jgi:hypothetical protein
VVVSSSKVESSTIGLKGVLELGDIEPGLRYVPAPTERLLVRVIAGVTGPGTPDRCSGEALELDKAALYMYSADCVRVRGCVRDLAKPEVEVLSKTDDVLAKSATSRGPRCISHSANILPTVTTSGRWSGSAFHVAMISIQKLSRDGLAANIIREGCRAGSIPRIMSYMTCESIIRLA